MSRFLVMLTVLSLVFSIMMTACGGGEVAKTSAPTGTPMITATATAMPASTSPVKIGVVQTFSGPMAMAGVLTGQATDVVEWQLKNQGGILGGREVKFIKGDDRGMVAEAAAQAKRLILEDKVTILTMGGITQVNETAVSDVAEELKVPYVAQSTIFNITDKKFTVGMLWYDTLMDPGSQYIIDVLKPKTIAWLTPDSEDTRCGWEGLEGVLGWGDRFKAAGINVVYRQYFPMDTIDFSPYLTKIKYTKPELLVVYLAELSQAVTINKQIEEMGGLGSIKYFGASFVSSTAGAVRLPAAVGSYVVVPWLPGGDDTGMKTFENAFKQVQGRMPSWELSILYNTTWTAVKAIELAGIDDPGKVAQALRSGNLEFDSAWGSMHINTEGKVKVSVMVAQVQEGGTLKKVWTWYPG